MNITLSDISSASRLAGFALNTKAMPGADEDYARLLQRYRLEDQFREAVDSLCVGLGLSVISATDQGLILSPEVGSVFSIGTITDFEPGLNPEQRVVTGLVHLCIASVAYPKSNDLDRSLVARVKVSQIERVLRETAALVAERQAEDGDAEENDVLVAFGILDRMRPRNPSSTKRSKKTTLGIIEAALDRLVDHGCARRQRATDADPEYQLLDRYRIQVQEMALPDAYEVVRQQMAELAEQSDDEPTAESHTPITTPGAAQ